MQTDSFTAQSVPQSSVWKILRPACNNCGASIVWGPLSDLPAHVKPLMRVKAQELLAYLGGDADAWLCTSPRCIAFGAFDPDSLGLS